MPLTDKGEEIKSAMEKEYGAEKGEQVFYASRNAGKISGVDKSDADTSDLAAMECADAEADKKRVADEAMMADVDDKIASLSKKADDFAKRVEGMFAP